MDNYEARPTFLVINDINRTEFFSPALRLMRKICQKKCVFRYKCLFLQQDVPDGIRAGRLMPYWNERKRIYILYNRDYDK